ncbi:hypothetical protein COBT_001417 [Conglomerata obtusa]
MAVIYIPKDPRTENIRFLLGHPDVLKDKINENDWDETINEINQIIDNSTKIDFFTIICNLLVIPVFFMKNTKMEDNLYKYLKYKNNILLKYGIFICHPKACQYNELRIIINDT